MLYAKPKITTTVFRRKPQSGIWFYCFGVLCFCYLIVDFILGNEKCSGKSDAMRQDDTGLYAVIQNETGLWG